MWLIDGVKLTPPSELSWEIIQNASVLYRNNETRVSSSDVIFEHEVALWELEEPLPLTIQS